MKPIIFSKTLMHQLLDHGMTVDIRVVPDRLFDRVVPPSHTGFAMDLATLCPYGQVGDVMWVRESLECTRRGMAYAVDHRKVKGAMIPKDLKAVSTHCSAMGMPMWAHRIQLKITGVYVHRLQEMNEEDFHNYGLRPARNAPVELQFQRNWNKTHREKWGDNPWVYHLIFQRMPDRRRA